MQTSLFQRSISACLAAVLTLAMLGSIELLAQHDAPAAQMARQTVVHA